MHIRPVLAAALLLAPPGVAQAQQPVMPEALAKLEAAKASLERATADEGGHRLKALGAVGHAIAEVIEEVKAGIEYDRTHASGTRENRH